MIQEEEIRPQKGPQEAFLSSPADIAIYGGSAGGGKALALTVELPTPAGWTTMGDVKVGDALFDACGFPCHVTHVHPVNLEPRECYRLRFDDGSTVEADGDHLWLTFDAAELVALTRRDPDWRAQRRARRPARIGGKKSALFSSVIQARNRQHPTASVSAPTGTIRMTRDIASSVLTGRGRRNYAIPVAAALMLPERNDLPCDPYTLGVWLGDGTTTDASICSTDPEILSEVAKAGFVLRPRKRGDMFGVQGLREALRQAGVFRAKHIPAAYLRGSRDQRLALLQGLLDTDGTVSKGSGAVEFTTTLPTLRDGVGELITSLGWKVRIREGRARLYGRDCGPKWVLKWQADAVVFRLPRKASRQRLATRRTRRFRYIVGCDRIPSVPVRCITVDSPAHLYLAGPAMIPTHNSWALMLDPLRYVQVPGFDAVIFRRTSPELTNPGGLWPASYRIYPLAKYGLEEPKANQSDLKWTFPPHGTSIKFSHMEHEDTHLAWRSSEVAMIGFDELTSFTEEQFFYMLSRNRTTCGVRPYMRAGTNPDADSWVSDLVAWWINQETGFPIPERAGVLRWMVRPEEDLVWAGTREELEAKYPDFPPMSLTFIPANVHDNSILLSKDPEYIRRLKMLLPVERERLLAGNWKIRPSAGLVFSRDNFRLVYNPPAGPVIGRVRYWDKAGTEGKGDYTAGVLMSRMVDGQYCVEDVVRGQWSSYIRNQIMKQTAIRDGLSTHIWVEQEPGSGGKESAEDSVRNLAGWSVRIERVTGDKVARARPFASQVQGLNVMVVQADWTKAFLDEHNGFPTAKHDDQVDAASGAFNKLAGAWIIPDYDEAAEFGGELPEGEFGGSFLD